MGECVCIILARGGSKGIPGKNIINIAGKPLIAHSILAAKASFPEMDIYVSSDSDDILTVASEFGGLQIQRPASLSDDTATSESALLHAVDEIAKRKGNIPKHIVFLQPTSPVREPNDIRNAWELYLSTQADSLFSGSPCHGFLWRRNIDNSFQSFSYDYRSRQRRQDAPHDVVENGSIYIFRTDILCKTGNRLGGKIVCYEMPWLYSFQIDDYDDLALTEVIFNYIEKR